MRESIDSILEKDALGSYRWLLYLSCGLLMFLEGYDGYIVANLAPVIARSMNIPIPSLGFIFTAQSAGMALGFYTIPTLADRIGRRNIILIGAFAFGVLTILSTMAGSLNQFIAVRFLAFMSLGGMMPTITAMVAEYLPTARRGRLLIWLYIIHGFGASAAGFAGPAFVAWHSWQAAFWAGGILMLAVVAVLAFTLPESIRYLILRDPQDMRIGRILRWIDPSVAYAPGTVFETSEAATHGLRIAALFSDGRATMTVLLWIAMGSALCVTATMTAWMPTYLHVLSGVPEGNAARMMAMSAVGAIVGPVLVGLLMRALGMGLALATTLALGFTAMSMAALVGSNQAFGWAIGILYGLLVIGSQAGLNSLVASSYPTSIRSTGIGWAGGIGRITSMIGPGIGGVLIAKHLGPWQIYPVIAAPLLLAMVAMLLYHRAGIMPKASAPAH